MNRKKIISACMIGCMAFTPASAVYAEEPLEAVVESQTPAVEPEENELAETMDAEAEAFEAGYQDPVEGFVARLYQNILERNPDASGLRAWVDVLKSGREQGAKVAQGFIESKEFQSKKRSDEDYIRILYATFLNRSADANGLKAWKNVLDSGMSRMHVFRGFVESQEFTKICQAYGIQRGNAVLTAPMDQNEGVTKFVARCYQLCLGRKGDEAGMNAWCNALLTGKNSAKEVAYGFFFSDEFQKKGLSDREYVKTLYNVLMGREPDTAGWNAWIRAIQNGQSRVSVFNDFGDSNEFQEICARYGVNSGKGNFIGQNTIDIKNYLSSPTVLVSLLGMQPAKSWQFGSSGYSYEKDGFYFTYHYYESNFSFSMKNEGANYITLYGVGLGESITKMDATLEENGWKVMWIEPDGRHFYGNILNGRAHEIELYQANGRVSSWYLNNWPEGEDVADFFDNFENR